MRTLQDIQPGQTLGRYEFLVPIAEGGMASVWAARLKGTRGFSKTVAVKTMLPNVSDDPQFEQMFLDEAQLASRIRHPNVVEIMDLGEQDEVLYLVMEWVDGEPLSNLRRAAAKAGGLPRSIAIRLVADACAGLHAAHELKDQQGQLLGLVHRDISPQNILVTFDGVVKIVDFGVAKAAGRSTGQTTAGQVKGKPPYMSPEQALGDAVDRRTDVFALGIILYQLTTGKHPFRGESDLVTLQNIVSDRPIVQPRAYDKQYPKHLEAVVMKALDRQREKRFASCADFEAALDEVFAKEVTRARTEDVSRFMKEMLGSRGEERRKALVEAIRIADERAQGRASFAEISPAARPVPMPASLTPASGTSSQVGLVTEESGSAPVTPFGATISTPAKAKQNARLVAGVVAAAAILLVVGLAMRGTAEPEPDPALAAPSPPAPVAAATAPPAAPQPEEVAKEPPPAAPEGAPSASVGPPLAAPAPVTRAPRGARPGAHPPPAAAPVPPVASAKPSAPKPKSTFVPPPMSDPGF